MNDTCVFCQREEVNTRGHHIIPRCKDGKVTVPTCESCESFIHSTWSHNELRDIYNSVEVILNNEKFQKYLKWILKQQPGCLFKTSRNSNRINSKYR